MPVPAMNITNQGELQNVGSDVRELLALFPGRYRVLRANSVVLLAPDHGSGTGPRDGEIVALAGDLKAMPLLGLLNMLGQNRETGRLVVQFDQTERVIMLRSGDVASVGSTAPEDRLGRFLVKTGKISAAQLDEAMAAADKSGARIGQALVQLGFLDAHQIWASIQEQITEIFASVVQWEEGSFVLYRSTTEYNFPSTPPLSMQGLLLEAVRRADEMSRYREKIPSLDAILSKTGKALPEAADELERIAFAAFADDIRISELARRAQLTEFDAMRTAYELLKRKVVQIVEAQDLEPVVIEPYALTAEDEAKLDVYNLAFREIYDEIVRAGRLDSFISGVMKYLSDPAGPHAKMFQGVQLAPDGSLLVQQLASNLGQLGVSDPWAVAHEALNELTFFMLFQCGELLDVQSDENLGRRVRLIHSALAGAR